MSPTRQAAAYGAIWESKLWSGLSLLPHPGVDNSVYVRTWPFRYVRMYEVQTYPAKGFRGRNRLLLP